MYEIRPLHRNEYKECADLLASSDYYANVLPRHLVGVPFIGLFDKKTLVGCCMVLLVGAQAYVDYLYVHPLFQQEGRGNDLVDYVVKYLQREKIEVMHACVHGENKVLLPMIIQYKPTIGWPYTNVEIDFGAERD